MKPIIYLDMDGVQADFEGTAARIIGPNWKKEIDKPNWGAFAEIPDWFLRLDRMPDALELYQGCLELVDGDKNRVQSLTALPKRAHHVFPDAAQHKIEWSRLEMSKDLRVHFGPFAQDKQYHISHEHDVLIDDMYINIKQWRGAGGIGIEHKSAETTLRQLKHAFMLAGI